MSISGAAGSAQPEGELQPAASYSLWGSPLANVQSIADLGEYLQERWRSWHVAETVDGSTLPY